MMDRITAVILGAVVIALLGVVYVLGTISVAPKPAAQNSIAQLLPKYPTKTVTARIYVKEGVGPNPGAAVDGATVVAYYGKISDIYNIPSDAMIADQENNVSDYVDVAIPYDPTYAKDGKLTLTFVAAADGYYKNSATAVAEGQTTDTDKQYDLGNIVIKLDKVATMGWTADDAFRGTDSPLLRYRTTDKQYISIFEIKPQVNFDTGNPSGVFIVKKIVFDKDANTDYTAVDNINITIGSVQFSDVSASDLPVSKTLDQPITVTADNPLKVQITVTTNDQNADLNSGAVFGYVKLEDVLGNTYTVPVKVA